MTAANQPYWRWQNLKNRPVTGGFYRKTHFKRSVCDKMM
ncbi:hypothetical protein ApDm4_2705 [Acetobacter pomorum]|nr:hypothetical protein ApDm4_2705 [Acetobacter pomorum]